MSNSSLIPQAGNISVASTQAASSILQARQTALSPMYYSARVTSSHPCCIVLLLDQSGSMSEEIIDNRGEPMEKATKLSNDVNKFLNEIILTCRKDDVYKDYFSILIVGYGREIDGDSEGVTFAWEGSLSGKDWVNVNELKDSYLRKEMIETPNPKNFGPRMLKEEYKIWIKPYAEGLTPMKKAFRFCFPLISDWVSRTPDSFPPLIFNITDGEISDVEDFSEIIEEANKIQSLATSDGNAILFNLLLMEESENACEFPYLHDRSAFGNSEYESAMFDAASIIPQSLVKHLPVQRNEGESVKGVILGGLESILSLLNIGTATLRNKIK